MNKLGNLFKLKEWMTIPEAAKHLSRIFDEDVTQADVLPCVRQSWDHFFSSPWSYRGLLRDIFVSQLIGESL